MRHPEFVRYLVQATGSHRYLELGLYVGETFLPIVPLVDKAVGVDILDRRATKEGEFYLGTTDSFFAQLPKGVLFDFVFIDADHSYESAKKDLENALKVLSDGGTIVLHDTDPVKKELLAQVYCGDSYRIIEYVHLRGDLDILTLPVDDPGLSIVRRKVDLRSSKIVP